MGTDIKRNKIGILGAFALSVGTGIGRGSFVVTGSNYLSKAVLVGSVIGILLGALLMFIIAYNYHYMVNQTPDSGGIYSFVKHFCVQCNDLQDGNELCEIVESSFSRHVFL